MVKHTRNLAICSNLGFKEKLDFYLSRIPDLPNTSNLSSSPKNK